MNRRHTLTHVALLMAAAWMASAGAAWAAPTATPPAASPAPGASAPAGAAPAAPAAPPIGAVDEKTRVFTHTAAYPPLALVWEASADAGRAIGVFPHPALPGRVVVATLDGLMVSDDAGATWRPLPQAARDRVGLVRGVAFSPERLDTSYLATDGKGVWATDDGGKAFRPLGTKASGLASDRVTAVHVYSGDRTFRTLMAVHGDAAAGISMTTDLGGTWRVVSPGYRVRDLLMGGPGDLDFFAAAARTDAPALVSLYYAVSLDDYWLELIKDIIPTGMARSVRVGRGSHSTEVMSGAQVFVATADAGLYRVDQGGGLRAGPGDLGGLAGVGVAWGPHADSERIYTYDPAKRGLIVSDDDLATVRSDARGLYTGALVKEGACVRASANGSVFYGIANDRLYVGRRAAGRLAVAGAAADPPVLTYEEGAYLEAMKGTREDIAALGRSRRAAPAARRLLARVAGSRSFLSADQVAVTARVTSAAGPPARVSVDLSRLGGSGLTPMGDDGIHGDGAAGDGVYGAVLHLDPRRFSQNAADRRRRPPGLMGLTVTAAAADGTLASEIAVLSLFNRLESFDVETRPATIRVAGGPWTHSLGSPYYVRDISEYQALTLRVRTDLEAGEEVRVQLADLPAFALPVTTPPVPVAGEGFVEGGRIGREWRQVVIPLKRLLQGAPDFRPARWTYVILSGDGRAPGTYEVTGVRFLIRAEEARATKGADAP